MSRRTIAALFVLEVLWLASLVFALADRRLHQREAIFGVNQWGYRGDARAERLPGEIRVAVIGGSSVYEPGVALSDTMASQLFYELRDAGAPRDQEFSVVNLSEPRVGADTYAQALRDYDFLDPEVVCILDGYDALEGLPPHARRRSLVFRATGYLPILPARLFGRPEWLSDAPGGIVDVLRDDGPSVEVTCDGAAKPYCASMVDAVHLGLQSGRLVVVVGPPIVSARHRVQQQSLRTVLEQQFGGDARFVYVDLAPWVDMSNPKNSPDGVRRTFEGDHIVSQQLGIAVVKLLAKARPSHQG
jgi:hypothetical protein